jgi:molecular chaperone DnaK (HSP70)
MTTDLKECPVCGNKVAHNVDHCSRCGWGHIKYFFNMSDKEKQDFQQELDQARQAWRKKLMGDIQDKKIKVVVGLDFGTSRSGYAYAFVDDGKIVPKTRWFGQTVPYIKTLTQLLYSPDKTFWGFEARDTFTNLRNTEAKKWSFFQNFKMQLHDSKDRTADGPRITQNGKQFLVLNLIADYLRFLKEDALAEIKAATSGYLQEDEIRWCLTIPAIWQDADKQLMRRAAQQAGIINDSDQDTERLILALEPECAALYCQEREGLNLSTGNRFMIVDCGGGTVDITVHEVVVAKNGQKALKEVIEGTGGAYGSTYVDKYFFETFLAKKLSPEIIEKIRNEKTTDYLEMINQWERIKTSFDCTKDAKTQYFRLTPGAYRLLSDQILNRLAKQQQGDDESIHITPKEMDEIFQSTLDGLVKTVQNEFDNLGNTSCDYIYLVGGFSTSPLLQRRITQVFQSKVKKIIIPPTPGAAIVEGAVSFGLNPGSHRSRVSRLTYGCDTGSPFEEGLDKENKKYWHEHRKKHYARDRFSYFVTAGQSVDIDECVVNYYSPSSPTQTEVYFAFFSTRKKQVRYTDEDGIEKIGEFTVKMPDTSKGLDRSIEVKMYFGKTEIKVEAKDLETGNKEEARLRFSSTYSTELIGE